MVRSININLKPYFNHRCELTVETGCLMWGMKVLVPSKLRGIVLKEFPSPLWYANQLVLVVWRLSGGNLPCFTTFLLLRSYKKIFLTLGLAII